MRGTFLHVLLAGLLAVIPSEISGFVLSPKKDQRKLQRLRRQEGAPAPAPKPESDEAVNGHWIKEAGADGNWHKENGNSYRKVPGVGNSGGLCTCPDGEAYEVGDMGGCPNLACEGGEAGECSEGGISSENFGMMVTCVQEPLEEAGAPHGVSHHSVFEIHLESLDNTDFWTIFIAMLLFAVAIDQAQEFLNRQAEGNLTTTQFLERVYGELMLFGTVALSIFIVENFFGDISEGTHLVVEFVDILCSVGAMSLILFAAAIYMVLMRDEYHWRILEEAAPPLSQEADAYQCIANYFRAKHDLGETFPMYTYLKRTLVQECIKIMRVEWTSWLLFTLFPVAGYIYRKRRLETIPDETILFYVTKASWALLLVHFLILCVIQYAYGSIEDCVAGEKVTWGRRSMKAIGFSMQMAAIFNSFMFAFYLMTTPYNSKFTERPTYWVILDGMPLLVNIIIMLPAMLTFFAPVQAFYCENKEIIGEILEENDLLVEDLQFLRKAWYEKEGKTPRDVKGCNMMDFDEFRKYLNALNIHMTKRRFKRLFEAIDKDCSGEISEFEFKKIVDGPAKPFSPDPEATASFGDVSRS